MSATVSHTVAEAQSPPPPPDLPVDQGSITQAPLLGNTTTTTPEETAARILELKHSIYNATIQLNTDIANLVALENELNMYEQSMAHLSLSSEQNSENSLEAYVNTNATSYTIGDIIKIDFEFYQTIENLEKHPRVTDPIHRITQEKVKVTLQSYEHNTYNKICESNHEHIENDERGPLPRISTHLPHCLVHPNGHITTTYDTGHLPPGEYFVSTYHGTDYMAGNLWSGGSEYGSSATFNITAPSP